MARMDFPELTRKGIDEIGSADLVIGIAGAVSFDALRMKVMEVLADLAAHSATGPGALKTVVAYAGEVPVESSASDVQFLPCPLLAHDVVVSPWVESSSAQRTALALALHLQARACVVLHGDLAALDADTLRLFAEPVLEEKCDLVVPLYPEGKYEGLINKSILAPLSRALYGKRVQSPLPFDFCASARVLAKVADSGFATTQAEPPLLWPANTVAIQSGQIGQAYVKARHAMQTDGLELSSVMTQLAGSLFGDVEAYAVYWQRVRGSQATALWGNATEHEGEAADARPLDTRPMIESFVLGWRNLEEVWRLVLPPGTLLELKRLTRLEGEQFRMPDELWARIVCDFALAYRLRNISRTHLLGALTPLYLGWVASYTQEVGTATLAAANQRIEQLARAFEESKPYLVSRWRWPDRFNP